MSYVETVKSTRVLSAHLANILATHEERFEDFIVGAFRYTDKKCVLFRGPQKVGWRA